MDLLLSAFWKHKRFCEVEFSPTVNVCPRVAESSSVPLHSLFLSKCEGTVCKMVPSGGQTADAFSLP